jgi:L-threonylcarbamoyladenylate synthase
MTTLDPGLIVRACVLLRAGGVVAYPTDTFYGLAADPRNPGAVARLFAIKGRAAGQAIPLIAADEAQALAAAEFDERSLRVARAFWPGPLSLVLPAAAVISKDARADDGTIAVRVPASDAARAIAHAFGFCITATSANLSGEEPSTCAARVSSALGGVVDLVLDGGDTPGGEPSTLVDAREETPRLVRAGAVAWDRVLRSVQ